MKMLIEHVLSVFLLALFSVSVFAENCLVVEDCTFTECIAGGVLVCDLDRKCTCVIDHTCTDGENVGVVCMSSRRCREWYESTTHHNCECADTHSLHCIDNVCMCGYPPNGDSLNPVKHK